jgi:RNA polymerase sigma factor (sigma-70 family)
VVITPEVSSFESATDSDLLAGLANSPAALEELFRRYRRLVVAYAARRCDRPADVDDVVAATFLAVLESASRYDPRKGEVRPWLLGIAHNQLGLIRRRDIHQRKLELGAAFVREPSEDVFARLEEQIAAVQETPEMQRALEQLSQEQREALLLVSRDELTPKEAAQALRITAATFRVRLYRARRAMQSLLTDPSGNPPTHSIPEEAKK